jgi:hypothetical protein
MSGRETKKMQMKLATTCSKNELRRDAKNNAKLLISWTKTTWKTFEVLTTRAQNRSIMASVVTDYYYYYYYCCCCCYGCDCFVGQLYCIFSLVSF